MRNCTACNGRGWVFDHGGKSARAVVCDCCTCDHCGGYGWVFETDPNGRVSSQHCPQCAPGLKQMELFNHARIPSRHREATFGNYDTHTPTQRAARAWFEKNRHAWEPCDRALLLSGPVGTGKTHLMCAWLRHLTLRRGIGGRFVEYSHLLRDIKAGYDIGKSDADIIAPLLRVPVLVIDELGKCLDTEWQRSILDQLISRRYESKFSTFATTNYPLTMGCGVATSRGSDGFRIKTLADVTGTPIASRLAEMCDVLTVDAPDRRSEALHELDPRRSSV